MEGRDYEMKRELAALKFFEVAGTELITADIKVVPN